MRYGFAAFTFDSDRLSLTCHGVALPLKPKTAALLGYFLEHPGRTITKTELMDALWRDEDVTEANLTQHVFLLRRLLAAHSPGETFVVTQSAKGYRFVAPVRVLSGEPGRRPGWREYARGRYYADQRTNESLASALRCFQSAREIDPANQDALAGIAFCHALRAEYLFDAPDAFEAARDAAVAALAIEPDHVEGLLALGDVQLFRDRHPDAALASYERALWRDPGSVRVCVFRAWLFGITGRFETGTRELETALGREPYSLEVQTTLAVLDLMRGAYADAIARCDEVLAFDPSHVQVRYYRRAALAYGDAPEEALAAFEAEEPIDAYRQQSVAVAGYAAGRCGNVAVAERMLDLLTGGETFGYVSALNLAHVLLGLKRTDEAIAVLERGVRNGDSWAIFLPHHPLLGKLKGIRRLVS